ncbi:hypothetical protein CAURIC_09830 [Corynebacterium auriscanis]|nr:hypothetical protein CAURIC_09830 [Corynebacterium auriscanis]
MFRYGQGLFRSVLGNEVRAVFFHLSANARASVPLIVQCIQRGDKVRIRASGIGVVRSNDGSSLSQVLGVMAVVGQLVSLRAALPIWAGCDAFYYSASLLYDGKPPSGPPRPHM